MATPPGSEPRIVLLTGAGRTGQVGEAVASTLASDGWKVLLVARDLAGSDALAAEIRAAGGDAAAYAADLADPAAAERLAADVRSDHGPRLDAVVHLAGGWRPGSPVADADPGLWQELIAINLLTAAYTARAFLPLVREGRGSFVFFASEAVLPGARVGGMAGYAVAKAGVAMIARALAQEERKHGVRANALAPASIRTASNERSMGEDAEYVERGEVAAAVRWLVSPGASAVSGEVIRLAATSRQPRSASG